MPMNEISPVVQFYIPLISLIISLGVGCFVLYKGSGKPVNLVIAGLAFSSVHYNLFQALSYQYPSIWLVRIGYIGAITLIPLLADFPDAVIDGRFSRPRTRALALAFGFFFLLVLPTDLLLKSNGVVPGEGVTAISGFLLKFFAGIIGILLVRIAYRLIKTLRNSPEELQKRRLEFILLALIFYSACALHDMLLRHEVFWIFSFPIVQLATLVFMIIVVYATMRFKLIDVDIVLGVSVYYMLLTLGTASIYKFVENFLENTLKNHVSSESWWAQMAPAFVVALLIGPFREIIQWVIDRLFLDPSYRPLKIFRTPNFQFLTLDSRIDELTKLRDELTFLIDHKKAQIK